MPIIRKIPSATTSSSRFLSTKVRIIIFHHLPWVIFSAIRLLFYFIYSILNGFNPQLIVLFCFGLVSFRLILILFSFFDVVDRLDTVSQSVWLDLTLQFWWKDKGLIGKGGLPNMFLLFHLLNSS